MMRIMNRSCLQELHYIAPIENAIIIARNGILCNNIAKNVKHISVADKKVQGKRSEKYVPGTGVPLHDYANLYIYARNPMLYVLSVVNQRDICVLQISLDVLNIRGAVITDGNAASGYTRFYPSPDGLDKVNWDTVFAESWDDQDERVKWEKKRIKCAEILVPQKVSPKYILGAYVTSEASADRLRISGFNLPIAVNAYLFFK